MLVFSPYLINFNEFAIIATILIYVRKTEGENVARKTTLNDVWAVKKLDFLFSIADALQMNVVAFFKPMTEESFQKWRRDH